jgi:hypothetical protein
VSADCSEKAGRDRETFALIVAPSPDAVAKHVWDLGKRCEMCSVRVLVAENIRQLFTC